MHPLQKLIAPFAAIAASLSWSVAGAQQFAAVVSPPRFELVAKPGERVRQVIEINNVGPQPATYYLRTADWALASDASVNFSDELAEGSCRPWVAIERREISVPGGGRYRYRFEVTPPADAPAGECRFALMIEGDAQTVQTAGGPNVPVSGRIGVIVYVTVGGAAPDMQIVGSGVEDVGGRMVPVLKVHNSGSAHGRLDGFLSGTDASGRKLEFAPSTLPILVGETRTIALTATDDSREVTDFKYPLRIRGALEWGDGKRLEFDQTFAR